MDNAFKEGWNAISFAGHAHMIHVEETALDNGETIQLITSHKFHTEICGMPKCPFCFLTTDARKRLVEFKKHIFRV